MSESPMDTYSTLRVAKVSSTQVNSKFQCLLAKQMQSWKEVQTTWHCNWSQDIVMSKQGLPWEDLCPRLTCTHVLKLAHQLTEMQWQLLNSEFWHDVVLLVPTNLIEIKRQLTQEILTSWPTNSDIWIKWVQMKFKLSKIIKFNSRTNAKRPET